MKFCAKCYQETFGNTNSFEKELRDKIADLEAKLEQYEKFMKDNEWDSIEEMQKTFNECEKKYLNMQHQLAESEKRNKELVKALNGEVFINYKVPMENAQLKQQLAEKEKEIDNLQDKLHHYYEETLNKGTCGLCEYLRGEYKTAFAIEQLEKVKKYADIDYRKNCYINAVELDKYIDQKIKQLKEGGWYE